MCLVRRIKDVSILEDVLKKEEKFCLYIFREISKNIIGLFSLRRLSKAQVQEKLDRQSKEYISAVSGDS